MYVCVCMSVNIFTLASAVFMCKYFVIIDVETLRPRWDGQSSGDGFRHPYPGGRGGGQFGGSWQNQRGGGAGYGGGHRWNAPHTESVHWDEAKECDPSDWTTQLPRNEKLEQ